MWARHAIISGVGLLSLVWGNASVADSHPLEYPYCLARNFNPENGCWQGMNASGDYPVSVDPAKWLVGPPPSDMSGVAIPLDCWLELGFGEAIIDGPGVDVNIIELGRAGEEAIIFLTDGADREYPIGIARALGTGGELPTENVFDLATATLPFRATAIRIVSLSSGGMMPGYDVGFVKARVAQNQDHKARNPLPQNPSQDVQQDAILQWIPGAEAKTHRVFLGTRPDELMAPVPTVPPHVDSNSFFRPSDLILGQTYYWRVDEVNEQNAQGPWVGDVWRFTVVEHVTIEGFEGYSWPYADTWTSDRGGLVLGCDAENSHHGCQYLNIVFYIPCRISHRFDPAQDWTTIPGASNLVIYVGGNWINPISGMTLALRIGDGTKEVQAVYPSPSDLAVPGWHAWSIPLSQLNTINLKNVETISFDISGDPLQVPEWTQGQIFLDDILLTCESYPSAQTRPKADLSGDYRVDERDLSILMAQWLRGGALALAVSEPNAPGILLPLDGTVHDVMGLAKCEVKGDPYLTGPDGYFWTDGRDDALSIGQIGGFMAQLAKGLTLTFWQNGSSSWHRNDTVLCSPYVLGETDPVLAIGLGCWQSPGKYFWICRSGPLASDWLEGYHKADVEWMGQWNNWAFTKDFRTGLMRVYLNGVLQQGIQANAGTLLPVSSFDLGSGWYGGYDGSLADVRVYDYALSQAEIAYLASDGTGVVHLPFEPSSDLNGDRLINFMDFSLLAGQWTAGP